MSNSITRGGRAQAQSPALADRPGAHPRKRMTVIAWIMPRAEPDKESRYHTAATFAATIFGTAAAFIEDSAQHDYAALTLLVPGQAVHTVLWLRLRTSLFQSKDEPEGIEG
jgi:hypothetical protein